MASTSKDKYKMEKGKKVPQSLPFLRSGEEYNVSPSKFERVLQYYSDEELEDMDEIDEFHGSVHVHEGEDLSDAGDSSSNYSPPGTTDESDADDLGFSDAEISPSARVVERKKKMPTRGSGGAPRGRARGRGRDVEMGGGG